MADCYSASGAHPLQALASNILGESSHSAKQRREYHQASFRTGLLHQPQYQQQQQQQQLHNQPGKHFDNFENVWTEQQQQIKQSSYHHNHILQHPHTAFAHPQHHKAHHPRIHHNHAQDEPHTMACYEQGFANDSLDIESGPSPFQLQEFNTAWDLSQPQVQKSAQLPAFAPLDVNEFETFEYRPSTGADQQQEDEVLSKIWAQHEVALSKTIVEDDSEDEFREEWSNDNFTRAYISSHQPEFKQIQEQEEQQQQRQLRSGGMVGPTSILDQTTASATVQQAGQRRLRVPGLDSPPLAHMEIHQHQHHHHHHHVNGKLDNCEACLFSVDEYQQFAHKDCASCLSVDEFQQFQHKPDFRHEGPHDKHCPPICFNTDEFARFQYSEKQGHHHHHHHHGHQHQHQHQHQSHHSPHGSQFTNAANDLNSAEQAYYAQTSKGSQSSTGSSCAWASEFCQDVAHKHQPPHHHHHHGQHQHDGSSSSCSWSEEFCQDVAHKHQPAHHHHHGQHQHEGPSSSCSWSEEFCQDSTHSHSHDHHHDRAAAATTTNKGVEWNWQKTLGPNRNLDKTMRNETLKGSTDEGGMASRNEKLQAVALSRLQAVLGHLSIRNVTPSA